MSMGRCNHGGYCVRASGHVGCHTAAPNAATLVWDQHHSPLQVRHLDATLSLILLDFPTPPWADLRD